MPETPEDKPRRHQQRRDAHDWATLAVLGLTLVAAACAAFFTAQQASIARDQEHRALRAYLVAKPEVMQPWDNTVSNPIRITLTNLGQTPAYHVHVFDWLSDTGTDITGATGIRCRETVASAGGDDPGITIGRDGVSRALAMQKSPDEKLTGDLTVAGTACYEDVFGEMHAARFCFHYLRETQSDECPAKRTDND
jgi:hypothetical protein